MSSSLDQLYSERNRLYQMIAQTGDFRRGSVNVNYRRCGKPNCACAQPDHPGHGPQYLFTMKINGKTIAKNLKSGPQLDRIRLEVANNQRFREIIREIVAINERICDLKDAEVLADAEATAKKGASEPILPKQSTQN